MSLFLISQHSFFFKDFFPQLPHSHYQSQQQEPPLQHWQKKKKKIENPFSHLALAKETEAGTRTCFKVTSPIPQSITGCSGVFLSFPRHKAMQGSKVYESSVFTSIVLTGLSPWWAWQEERELVQRHVFTCAGLRGRCGRIWAHSVPPWLWFEINTVCLKCDVTERRWRTPRRKGVWVYLEKAFCRYGDVCEVLSMLSSRTFCKGNVLYLCCPVC